MLKIFRSKRKLSLYVATFLRVVINVDKNSGELFFGNLSYQPNLTYPNLT